MCIINGMFSKSFVFYLLRFVFLHLRSLKFILFLKLKTYVHIHLQSKLDKIENIEQTF